MEPISTEGLVEKIWTAPVPPCCELCGDAITDTFVDGKTTYGGWALMCAGCHGEVGQGLGLGHGQQYQKQGESFVLS